MSHKQRESRDDAPPGITSVAIIGAGVMGRGIAAANIERGVRVMLADVDDATARSAVELVLHESAAASKRGRAAIHAGTLDQVHDSQLVIEAVSEKLAIKQQVLARAEQQLAPDAIVASNTSSISITKIAGGLKHPERFCGLHFCHPVENRALVEVVRGDKTSETTVAAAVAYVRSLGKLPIVISDSPGFLVNRLLTPYLNEAIELVLEGASIGMVEACAREFGMPLGPLRQFDEYGIDVAVRTGALLRAAYSDRMVGSDLPVALYQSGRLGRKTGAGFFTYTSNRPFDSQDVGTFDDEVRGLIDKHRRTHRTLGQREITERLFLPMLLEATRILDEQLVGEAAAVDAALQAGLGFVSPYGGLLRCADALGANTILEMLDPFKCIGKRYEPTALLLQMAVEGRMLHDSSQLFSRQGLKARAA